MAPLTRLTVCRGISCLVKRLAIGHTLCLHSRSPQPCNQREAERHATHRIHRLDRFHFGYLMVSCCKSTQPHIRPINLMPLWPGLFATS